MANNTKDTQKLSFDNLGIKILMIYLHYLKMIINMIH